MRRAIVRNIVATSTEDALRVVRAYLPDNYQAVVAEVDADLSIKRPRYKVEIEGKDNAGWTLDDYVIPRLASGLYFAEEST